MLAFLQVLAVLTVVVARRSHPRACARAARQDAADEGSALRDPTHMTTECLFCRYCASDWRLSYR
jgi:hypothetical protein